jgi:dihydroflavonol-4-reductase
MEGGQVSTSAPVLVTGATGFVGGLLSARMLADGRRVRGLSRRPVTQDVVRHVVWGPAGPPEDPGGDTTFAERRGRLEIAEGHLGDSEALARAADGCEVVYHVAGVNTMCLRDPAPMYEANVEGTRRVLEAARAAGVRRVVFTSSAAALGGDGSTAVDETNPPAATFVSHYARSKSLAEQLALSFGDVEVVAVNPSSVQGPGRRSGTARILVAHLNGRLRFVIHSRFGICFTEDCVAGHLLAETKGEPGQRYVLNTATLTTSEAIDLVGGVAGLPAERPRSRPRTLPASLASATAAAVAVAFRARGKRPPLCPETIRTIARAQLYDGSRAERDLGLAYTPVEEALRACVGWYVHAGLVTRPLPGLTRS